MTRNKTRKKRGCSAVCADTANARKPKQIKKLGLSMGTFNPIHLWHLQVAQCAWEEFGLDLVLFIPNGQPPHKEGVAPKELRLRMTQRAIAGNAHFQASRIEIDREGLSYTVDTLRALKRIYGDDVELNLIVGMDNLDKMQLWHEAPEIHKLCKLLIAPRNSRLMTREKIAELLPADAQWDLIQCPDSDISSTVIRGWIESGHPRRADYVVPNAVRCLIQRHGLYRKKKPAA